ncbi:MAG: outer membrane channel protein [Syntrophorhabdus sp. PtaB.Bin006]|nr:MAG: outer membrane channel protein [Syntrophorhabdus sp. PtaB.Bin006]
MISLSAVKGMAAQVLDYDTVTEKALRYAHDIRMSRLDIDISRSALKSAYSLYYPTISARWNTEYVKDLTDGTAQVNAVGNTVFVQNTLYQSAFMFVGNYNLFDFGVAQKKVFMAERDVHEKKNIHKQSVRDIKLKVLNTYSNLLACHEELETKKELLKLSKELSLIKERLFVAGTISRIDMVNEALKTIKIVDEIDNLAARLKGLLEDLSFLTGEDYSAEGMKVSRFRGHEEDFKDTFNPENTPESRIYDLEIEKKKAELQALQRGLLPQLALYSSYVWYGSHPSEFDTSAQQVRSRSFSVGLSITVPLFEGFKTPAEVEKVRLEMERLALEKGKKLAELSNRYAKLRETRKAYAQSVANQQGMMMQVEEKLDMVQRLAEQKAIEWADFLNQKMELLNQKLEFVKIMTAKSATTRELRILSLSEAGD